MSTTSLPKHDLAGKRIVVAGGGLAGLAFAIALDQFWPDGHPKPEVVLYERSARELDREREGYTMSIKAESGLKALKEVGLLEKALSNSTTGHNGVDSVPTLWNSNWQPILDLSARKNPTKASNNIPPAGIRLVRYVLRDMLLNAVPSSTKIHWSKGCSKASLLDTGKVHLTFSDASTSTCDLLIAADGAKSAIRSSLLPDQTLEYAGVVAYMGTSRFAHGKPAPLSQGKWGMNLSSAGVPFLTFPVDAETMVWGLTYRSEKPRERIRGAEAIERREEILEEVRRRGAHLGGPFREIVEATDAKTLQVFK
ncbi:hypothetical protein E8E13_004490 [Curvularia kusanoi]|uniref:FAD-binding domain-containing protein n=1 Tax=Curvularia kusanoi TaxID=90978 RepID=A0A9P4T5U3_CURKU|nr:hypothetical protein E8E13_004490 [Curvularia kusanoi]